MSAAPIPHDGWPTEGTTFDHWADLLLAVRLAALRSGYTAILKKWFSGFPTMLTIRCHVEPGESRFGGCAFHLVKAKAVDPVDLAGPWIVERLRVEHLDRSQHRCHTMGIGTSKGFLKLAPKSPSTEVGRRVKTWRKMHAIEGCLRAEARRTGRYLISMPAFDHHGAYLYSISCCVGDDRCPFLVRFSPKAQHDGAGWICTRVQTTHTCTSHATAPNDALQKALRFWPTPQMVRQEGPLVLRPRDRRKKNELNKTDQHLGRHPVTAKDELDQAAWRPTASTTTTSPNTLASSVAAPLDPAKLAELDERRSSLERALSDLQTKKKAVRDVQTQLSLAEMMDDLDGVAALKPDLAKVEAERAKAERKVEKKRNKVKELTEKVERKKGAKAETGANKVEARKSKPVVRKSKDKVETTQAEKKKIKASSAKKVESR